MTYNNVDLFYNKEKIGYLIGDVLMEHSELIQKSYENKNNFDGKLISMIDLNEINVDDSMFDKYVLKKQSVNWKNIVDIINGTSIFYGYSHLFMEYTDKTFLSNLVIVNVIVNFLQISILTDFCSQILKKYKVKKKNNNLVLVNMSYYRESYDHKGTEVDDYDYYEYIDKNTIAKFISAFKKSPENKHNYYKEAKCITDSSIRYRHIDGHESSYMHFETKLNIYLKI